MVEEHPDHSVSFVGDGEADGGKVRIVFYPFSDKIYLRTTLTGRCTRMIGGRRWPPHKRDKSTGNADGLQDGNDLAVKVYWPEESGTSEVEILKMAKEYGEKIAFIGNHIPEVVCHKDPVFVGSSTGTIRRFLGLSTEGSRRLRVIVFRRLVFIAGLKEKEMLLAYFQCLFCECNYKNSLGWFLITLCCRSLLPMEGRDPAWGHHR